MQKNIFPLDALESTEDTKCNKIYFSSSLLGWLERKKRNTFSSSLAELHINERSEMNVKYDKFVVLGRNFFLLENSK